MTQIDVAQFGAAPGDGAGDRDALREAFAAAAETAGPVVVRFEPGRYDIPADPDNRQSFFIEGVDDLTLDGNGAELVFHGETHCFLFRECKRLDLGGFTIDWAEPPFSQATIVAKGERFFDARVHPGYAAIDGMGVQAFQEFDPKTRIHARDGVEAYYGVERTELLEEDLLRVHLKYPVAVTPGNLVVLRHRAYGFNGLVFERCEDVRLHDATVYCVPGMACIANKSHNLTLERFDVRKKPGTDRMMSATADACHLSGCTGLIRMDQCLFEGMGDDAGNIKSGLYLTVQEVVDERTVVGRHNLGIPAPPDPGDQMEFLPVDTLLTYATRTVAEVQSLPEGKQRVTFEAPLPEQLEAGDVIGNATRVARVHISNCEVRENRARGFLIQVRGGLIENCRFQDCTAAGIMVMSEVVHFFESITTRDITIRNCEFVDCGFSQPGGEGVVQVYAYLKDFAFPPEPGVHRNIAIENNTIRGGNNAGIFVTSTDGVRIVDNTISGVCERPRREGADAAIHLMSTANAVIQGNRAVLAEQGADCAAPLSFGPGVEKDTIEVTGNTGF